MPDDPNSVLRAELTAALAVIDPQIRGLEDLLGVSISDALKDAVNLELLNRRRRGDAIMYALGRMDATIAAIEALLADGYPDLPQSELPPELFDELQGENSDIDAAVVIFDEVTPATTLSVELGEPTDKPDLPATTKRN